MPETLLHIIDNLSIGGAEILLKNTIDSLPEFEHIVVYLNEGPDQKIFDSKKIKYYNLNHTGWASLPATILKLRNLVRSESPLLVHSHLIISTLVARLSVPATIPLVSTLHSELSMDAFSQNKLSLWLEKLTLKKRHSLVAVSNHVMQDYLKSVSFSGKKFVLYNFLTDVFFDGPKKKSPATFLKCVAVGNLKTAKNYDYLLDIFKHPGLTNIHLDIYGTGDLEAALQDKINKEKLPVTLKGNGSDPHVFLKEYDLFIQASSHEGFGLSVIEAMASGLPVLLSDIPVFREVTNNHAHFFPLNNAKVSAELLEELNSDPVKLNRFTDTAYEWCKLQFNARTYKARLLDIYSQITTSQ